VPEVTGRAPFALWQAESKGVYDNVGFRLRGHQFTDAAGRYRFLTIMPASHEGRTRHFHVKVQAPGGRVLTTQLYFPSEAHNRSDRLFRRGLLLNVTKTERVAARFDFVLDVPSILDLPSTASARDVATLASPVILENSVPSSAAGT
jgi:protocatechuate 3,4-dioxygenase beta subunit